MPERRPPARGLRAADLDRYDRAILRIVQRDNKLPQRAIAEEVGLSTPAVQRRLVALEAAGVIAANVAVLDAHSVSATITAIVELVLTDEHARTVDAAKALFLNTPEVQQCYYVTGGVSFMLIVVAPDMPSYERLTRRLFAENPSVKSYRSLVALDRVKVDTAIVVPD